MSFRIKTPFTWFTVVLKSYPWTFQTMSFVSTQIIGVFLIFCQHKATTKYKNDCPSATKTISSIDVDRQFFVHWLPIQKQKNNKQTAEHETSKVYFGANKVKFITEKYRSLFMFKKKNVQPTTTTHRKR